MTSTPARHFHSLIVGGGPAGTGPLVYGAWSGRLPELLDRGLAVVEAGTSLGDGRLGRYVINSNSTGATFLECLEHGVSDAYLQRTLASPLPAEVNRYRDDVLPLALAGKLLRSIGDDLCGAAEQSTASKVYLRTRAEEIRVVGPGRFEVSLKSAADAAVTRVSASRVLIATGGNARVACDAGASLAAACRDNGAKSLPMMMTSDELLTEAGRRSAEAWLDGFDAPQVVVVGGAHSALSSAWLLLERMRGEFSFDDGAILLLNRAPIKVYYDTLEAARADGYAEFGPDDVGGKGQVYPIAGLRGNAKALYRQIAGIGDATPEPRVRVLPLPTGPAQWRALPVDWQRLALVVFSTGYVQPSLAIRSVRGAPISLHGHYTERYVDQSSRVLDALGAPIPGLYATGFTTGFSPVQMLSGEPSYQGKENSVWLCQHLLGESLFNALLA